LGASGISTLPSDFDRFEQLLEGAIRRIPILENAEMIGLTCHPGAYSPDCQPMIGPMPGVRGLWMACGMSLNGFGGAGGIGKILTEWIIDGNPSLDVYAFKATRLGIIILAITILPNGHGKVLNIIIA